MCVRGRTDWTVRWTPCGTLLSTTSSYQLAPTLLVRLVQTVKMVVLIFIIPPFPLLGPADILWSWYGQNTSLHYPLKLSLEISQTVNPISVDSYLGDINLSVLIAIGRVITAREATALVWFRRVTECLISYVKHEVKHEVEHEVEHEVKHEVTVCDCVYKCHLVIGNLLETLSPDKTC